VIGDRIRQVRLAAGFTLDEVVQMLADQGQSITKAGLSKYENGKSTPKPAFLTKLAAALGVRASYFVREPAVAVEWLSFRRHSSLTKTRQEQIKAAAARVAEHQVWLFTTLYPRKRPRFPIPREVSSLEDAEAAAWDLRKAWRLGDGMIESVTQSVEDRGGIVVGFDEEGVRFDGLSGRADSDFPVIVVNRSVPDDRRRYDLSHELGHLMMDCDDLETREQEQLAHRFAAAFLVPAEAARGELGAHRRSLELEELALLKQRYGLSMQAWARRAVDLEIISQSCYRTLCMQFNAQGWRRREPVGFVCNEEPIKLKQMTLRALAEGIITAERAEEICPGCTGVVPAAAERRRPGMRSARELLSLPRVERERILAVAAADAQATYRTKRTLTEFEALGERDLYG
jgi:Zn-dependent peptidase ImmA (M78 family)/transcriptional regulator with XRE-family HTH domain